MKSLRFVQKRKRKRAVIIGTTLKSDSRQSSSIANCNDKSQRLQIPTKGMTLEHAGCINYIAGRGNAHPKNFRSVVGSSPMNF